MTLEIKNISFAYSKYQPIFKNFSLTINNNERVGIVAPSGYGKTTLANIIAGILPNHSGEIILDGKKVDCYGNEVKIISQHPEKVFNPKKRLRIIEKEIGCELSADLIEGLKIDPAWLNRYPNELSGGELQRLSIARIMSCHPKYLIADEISAMLDVVTQSELWSFILEYTFTRQIGLIIMSHNQYLLDRICSRQIELS